MPLGGWARLREEGRKALDRLRVEVTVDGGRFALAHAGLVGDRVRFGIFPRDLLSTGLIADDRAMIWETLRFCAATIGSKTDPRSGEEPGRVLHEYPPHERDGLSTQYNACETSHLFLIAAEGLLTADRGEEVLGSIRPALQAAGAYLLRHLEGDLFWEDPRHAGARRYLLPATYWKDSFLPGRRELRFPVAYTLVQAQTVAALRALAALTEALDLGFDPRALTAQARAMIEVVWNVLWDEEAGYPALALDDGQLVRGVSSDGLHLLAYLRPDDVPAGRREELARRAQELVTP
ncbi:MAG TPA: hypothetical protein ENN53_02250, partial [Candidatus Acetothermia bacterium]|nr:hypothetical protein [Candidatus Acetothermia bacterium]